MTSLAQLNEAIGALRKRLSEVKLQIVSLERAKRQPPRSRSPGARPVHSTRRRRNPTRPRSGGV
jgi:hypothetical protein